MDHHEKLQLIRSPEQLKVDTLSCIMSNSALGFQCTPLHPPICRAAFPLQPALPILLCPWCAEQAQRPTCRVDVASSRFSKLVRRSESKMRTGRTKSLGEAV